VSFTGQDLGAVSSAWTVEGVGDFAGNGKDGILWRNSATGDVYLWDANPGIGGSASFTGQDLGIMSSAWSVQGVGDFNGDGKSDILWRNAATGEIGVWDSAPGTTVSFTFQDLATVSSAWAVQQVGDFNGDGRADILWRNSATGDTYLWDSAGGAVSFTPQDGGTQPLNWQL
jgi:hypothetical protein